MVDKKTIRNAAVAVTAISGIGLIGVLPGIMAFPVAGTTLSVLLGIGNLGVAYGLFKYKV